MNMQQLKKVIKRSIQWIVQRSVLYTDLLPEPFLRDEKWIILNKVMRALRSWKLPPGDYLEFGVYRALSFIHAYQLAQRYGLDTMHFYAFDSFEGLPDAVHPSEEKYKHFSDGQFACSEKDFHHILSNANVNLNKITTIPGYYNESLTNSLKHQLAIQRAAVVWIDCDLYSSTVPVLDFIAEYLTTGSFLIFDDWFSFGADPEAGEMRACQEWLAHHPEFQLVEYHKFHTAGISFLVQKQEDAKTEG